MWGSVCADPNWDYKEANVTCRMLGHSDGQPRRERNKYGYSTYPVWMNHVYCNGTEEHLANCSFSGWAFSDSCYFPAGVFCYNITDSSDIAVRLEGGPDTNVGRVAVFYSGMWGAVCADPNWADKEAIVTCRMLGHR
ncbi:neurotrypsin-like [Mizuhopecten yessoensis]|uniref:neurotrypsin-like n=1 Tax=Mizuhopecten yessoensis TaxID=6573 RepID=UPI000B4585B1|nr:neurotrypsin-like [Mizuhopecten yessoensis]